MQLLFCWDRCFWHRIDGRVETVSFCYAKFRQDSFRCRRTVGVRESLFSTLQQHNRWFLLKNHDLHLHLLHLLLLLGDLVSVEKVEQFRVDHLYQSISSSPQDIDQRFLEDVKNLTIFSMVSLQQDNCKHAYSPQLLSNLFD